MLSNTWQQLQGIVTVPDPVDCPLCLVDKHLIEPIPGQEGGWQSTQVMLVSYVMSAKRHCQILVFGTVTNPKITPHTGVQYASMHCVLILVLGYITLKRTTQVK